MQERSSVFGALRFPLVLVTFALLMSQERLVDESACARASSSVIVPSD